MPPRLTTLSPTSFENLAFDLLIQSGMRNLSWRTPGADGGRDLEGEILSVDFAGSQLFQRWYVEIKRYSTAISWPVVWEKIAYADSAGADYLLFITTSSFSPKCIDELNKWNANHRFPIVRAWSKHDVEARLQRHPAILLKYGLATGAPASTPAFASISAHLAKMTMAADASLHMEGRPERYLSSAVALSELLMVRSEDFKSHGRVVSRVPLKASPWYDWVSFSSPDIMEGLDAPAIRALMSALYVITMCDGVCARRDGLGPVELIRVGGIPIGEGKDTVLLTDVAFWGNFQITVHDDRVLIYRRD